MKYYLSDDRVEIGGEVHCSSEEWPPVIEETYVNEETIFSNKEQKFYEDQ